MNCLYAKPMNGSIICLWAAMVERPPWMFKPKVGPQSLITEETCEKCKAKEEENDLR
jgi:hypothetical protein